MVFGPAWYEPTPQQPLLAGAELLPLVRKAAEQLMADLQHGERLTANWTEPKLADAAVDAALSACLNRLAATGYWGEANQLGSSELWRIAGPLLKRGTLQNHARSKPYGYAGDHEMLTRIWQRSCCEDRLGAAFDRYFLRQAAPQAVRARLQQTAAAMTMHCLGRDRDGYEVASVGSGPAIDVYEALRALAESRRAAIRVRLLDIDPQALEVASTRLAPMVPADSIASLRTNLYRLPQQARGGELLGRPDLIICSGLFDYLADEPAVAMLRLFWKRLAQGGMLLVGNFAPHNPTRAYMEWLGNWYLLYRTASAFEQLASAAGIPPGAFTIGCDRTGVDLFLVAEKTAT